MHTTHHRLLNASSTRMTDVADESIDLLVTSPPYPMIAMWDESFAAQSEEAEKALERGEGGAAFEAMHLLLDSVWSEGLRVLKPGAFACINIGDAVRSLGGNFRLYSNHVRICSAMEELGFQSLPPILWRKESNSPTKFLGSGMLPSGAYVTLEHEYILVFRKGGKRMFTEEEKARRRRSAFFWEERNSWFSDLWNLKGVRQRLTKGATGIDRSDAASAQNGTRQSRERSGAYPFELAYRLVNMYSLIGDTVLDPFLGTGTSLAASLAAGRNSIGFEIDTGLIDELPGLLHASLPEMNGRIRRRFEDHLAFLEEREKRGGKKPGHLHEYYRFPVITKQERELRIPYVEEVESGREGRISASYRETPAPLSEKPL